MNDFGRIEILNGKKLVAESNDRRAADNKRHLITVSTEHYVDALRSTDGAQPGSSDKKQTFFCFFL